MLIHLQLPFRVNALEVEIKKNHRAGEDVDLVYLNGRLSFTGRFHICSDGTAWYRSPIPSYQSFAEQVLFAREVPAAAPETPSLSERRSRDLGCFVL